MPGLFSTAAGQVAGIQAGSGLLGQGINAISTGIQNKKMRRFAENMYNKQRADALTDWAMQNDYNHPSKQMQRLREAGLNPMLVYGNGADGNAAQQVRSSNIQNWSPNPIQFDLGSIASDSLRAYQDMTIKTEQARNLQAQNQVLEQDAALRAAQVVSTLLGTEGMRWDIKQKEFEYKLKGDLRQNVIETAVQNLEKLRADTRFTMDQNKRANEIQPGTLKSIFLQNLETIARTAKTNEERNQIREMIKKIHADTRIAEADANLREMGIQPGDKIHYRVGVQAAKWLVNKLRNTAFKPGNFKPSQVGQGNPMGSGFKKRKKR